MSFDYYSLRKYLAILYLNVFPKKIMRSLILYFSAPPLVFLVTQLTSSEEVMGEHKNGKLLRILGYSAAAIMSVAALALVITSL